MKPKIIAGKRNGATVTEPAGPLGALFTVTRKVPQRKSSVGKLERITDAASRLLKTYSVNDVTIAMLAEHSGVSRTTIYDFFPTVMAVYEQVAQAHVVESNEFMLDYLQKRKPVELFEVVDTLVDAAVEFFNTNHAARKTMLGTGALEMHLFIEDFEGLCAQLYHMAYKGEWAFEAGDFRDPFRHLATIQSALYTNSVQRHGLITEYMADQVKAASRGYLNVVLGRN